MNKRNLYGLWLLLLLGVGCAGPVSEKKASDKIGVMVSIAPLGWLAGQVGQGRVEVDVFLPPGQSMEVFDPTARHLSALEEADLLLVLGAPFEQTWLRRVRAAMPGLKVVVVSEGLPLLKSGGHHAHGTENHPEAEHAGPDPHFWVSPKLALRVAKKMEEAFSAQQPQGAADFRKNRLALQKRLLALHQSQAKLLGPHRGKTFLVLHPELAYLAHDHGLKQLAIEADGHDPTPRQLQRTVEEAEKKQLRLVLAQRELSQKSANVVAGAIGARVVSFSVLREDCYSAELPRLARLLAKEFSQKP